MQQKLGTGAEDLDTESLIVVECVPVERLNLFSVDVG